MPRERITKAELAKMIEDWYDPFLEKLTELAKEKGNLVRRKDINAELPDLPDKVYKPLTDRLLEEKKIVKAGAARGRGAGYALSDLPAPVLEEIFDHLKPKEEVVKTLDILVAGKGAQFARSILRARVGVDSCEVTENAEEADLVCDHANAKNIVSWFNNKYN